MRLPRQLPTQKWPFTADRRAPKTGQAAIAAIAPEPEILFPTPLRKFRALFKLLAMDWSEIGRWAGALVLIAAFFMLPRWFSFRHRAIAGTILFPLGWAGVFSGIAAGNRPFMQSEAVAYTWLGISCLAIVLAITLLVPVFFEWLRKRRKPKRTTESWRGGHLKR